MATGIGLSQLVVEAKQRLAETRQQLRARHDAREPARSIGAALADLQDSIVLELYHAARSDLDGEGPSLDEGVSLVLHGSSGRRDPAPYSDVDLMLLHRGDQLKRVQALAQRLARDIIDVGFRLGFSCRTVHETSAMALRDAAVFSSLTESRLLGGSGALYENYFVRLRRLTQRRATTLARNVLKARAQERAQFGETVFLLRPDVKRSRGALRDIHLIRWLGFVRHGETDLDQLAHLGSLADADVERLRAAHEFLLRTRHELHFHAGRPSDMLERHEQVRIAEKFGYQGLEGLLPVEMMMRDYFHHTGEVRYACDHFVASFQTRRSLGSVLAPLMTRPLDKEFRLGPYTVGVIPAALPHVKNKLPKVLRLMHLSNAFGKDIDHDTWESIRQAMKDEPQLEWSSESASQFMALLEETSRLGFLLGRLREMRVLEHIIPAFGHARGLLQFNEYHKYTVDEHSILAVERATEFLNSRGTLGTVYRSLREKHLLHLALLIHDLGKGFAEDHSEVGRRIAEETATRLELDREDAEDVKFLVHNHLMMAHVAFRRDINDEAMVAEFAANVGSVKLLKMLYLLTCADIAAVGPNTLSDWKLELLTDLYHNAKNLLTGHHGIDGAERGLEDKFAAIAALGSDPDTQQWLARQARALPRNYCRGHAPELIAGQLLDIKDAVGDHTRVWVESLPAKRLVELSIGKRERLRSGIFYRVNGLLASLGLKIVNADIKHLTNSLVWYWFQFEDPDFAEPPAERLQQIRDRTLELVRSHSHEPIEIASRWQADYDRTANLPRAPIRVQIDNQTVQSANVIDVFAHYRLGLQYVISKRIYELGLDVRFARISTYGEQIVNVFYVTDEHGQKIRDARRLVDIRRKLLQVTREFLGETDTGTTRSEAAG